MNEPRVVGVDPSLTCTGIASSDGWIETVGSKNVTLLELPDRVDAIDTLATSVIEHIRSADLVVVEKPLPSGRNPADTSSIERHALYWLIMRWLIRHDVPVVTVNNRHRAAYATGNPSGTKVSVVEAAAEWWPKWKCGKNNNKADAVTLMALGRHALGYPVGEVPTINTRTISKIEWPVEAVKARLAERTRGTGDSEHVSP